MGGGAPVPVALSLGGNTGDVRRRLADALVALAAFLHPDGLGRLAVSPLYRTAPVSPLPQPDFLNAAAAGWTARTPREVLAFGQELERAAGRRPGPRWGPRPLDVDLLVWDDAVVDEPGLVLPHPRLAERGFVLVPLADVVPGLRVPPDGATVAELLARLEDRGGVEPVPWGEEARRLGIG